MALTEETLVHARNGRIVNPSLARCTPTSRRSTSTTWMNPTRPRHWLIGVGEVGITDADAAIANAVHRATGKRVRDLPITPNELL
jgi:xanthine dehydrogenase YagR molybdenum-binding subunit